MFLLQRRFLHLGFRGSELKTRHVEPEVESLKDKSTRVDQAYQPRHHISAHSRKKMMESGNKAKAETPLSPCLLMIGEIIDAKI